MMRFEIMRLLIFAKHYLPEISALSTRLSQMARGFCRRDPEMAIRIVTFDPEGRRFDTCAGSEDRIEVRRYVSPLPLSALKPQSLNPLLLALWTHIVLKEIRDFKPDVTMATTPPFVPVIALYLASSMGGRSLPYLIDYRDDLSSFIDSVADMQRFYLKYPLKGANSLMSSLLRHALSNASLVCTVNESLQKDLLRTNRHVLLVPNGLDVAELDEIARTFQREKILSRNGITDTKSRVIVYLGDLDMSYHIPESILEPLKHLRNEGYNLIYVIIGEGKRRTIIEGKAREMGMQDFVYLVGRKNHKEAMELLKASDVAFYPLQKSYPQARHAIATKVYEYIGCKLPILVVADNGSAVSELVRENGVGLSLSWDETERIGFALKDILDHPEIYRNNLEKRYQDFLERFDRNKGIDRLYENLKALGPQ